MRFLGKVSINRKLTVIIMSVVGIVLLLVCTAFIIYDRVDFKRGMVLNLRAIADMSGTNCTAALLYDYSSDAAEVLVALKAEPFVTHAIIYTKDGNVFASYHRQEQDSGFVPPQPLNESFRFRSDHLDLFHPIIVDNEQIGTVYIQASLQGMHARLRRQIEIIAIFLLVASFLALVLASRLKKVISSPILHLAHVATVVSDKKDYSIRAQSNSHDEMGYLIDSFNDMLEDIQNRDRKLQQAQNVLKDSAEKLATELAERKRTEKALQFMRFSIDHAAISEFHMTKEGQFVYVNDAACKSLGYSLEEMLSMSIFDIDPDISEDKWSEHWNEISKRRSFTTESTHRTKNGKLFPVEITFNYIQFEGDEYNCAFAQDIAERKEAIRRQRELQDKLERAQRMESLGILAGGVAHDLNNMLGPLVGYSELILSKLPEGDPLRKQVVRISNAAMEAADVIQDLLTLARRGRYDMKPTDLNLVIETYLDSPSFAGLAEKHRHIKINIDLDRNLVPINGSASHLSKVIMNLIVNAFDAMPNGGTVEIATSQQYVKKLLGGYDKVSPGDYVLLRVRDTGIGIAPECLDKIFEPYYSKKKMGATSGSGLGLSVVYGITKDHKGYYDISSTVGEGTEFILYFPVAEEPVRAEEDSEINIEGNETVLVVDDVGKQRVMAKELLSNLGYKVETVNNGHDAVRYLRDHCIDIVVLDMIMEMGFDGLDTYREIIKLHPEQKAVIISGFSATERVSKAQRLGAGSYIKKPYTLKVLGEAVRKELDRKPSPVV